MASVTDWANYQLLLLDMMAAGWEGISANTSSIWKTIFFMPKIHLLLFITNENCLTTFDDGMPVIYW